MALKLWAKNGKLVQRDGIACASEECPCLVSVGCSASTAGPYSGLASQRYRVEIANLGGACASKYNGVYYVDFAFDNPGSPLTPSDNWCRWSVPIPSNDDFTSSCGCTGDSGGGTPPCELALNIVGDQNAPIATYTPQAFANVELIISKPDNTVSSRLRWITVGTNFRDNLVSGATIPFYPAVHQCPPTYNGVAASGPAGWTTIRQCTVGASPRPFELTNADPFGDRFYSGFPAVPIPGGWSLGALGSGMYDAPNDTSPMGDGLPHGVSNSNPATCLVTAVL
jgi:hypothetical protein